MSSDTPRITVVGDLIIDEYILGVAERLSPEAPVPIVRIAEREHRLGGAANTALNVVSLGGSATVVGVVGGDAGGAMLVELLRRNGVRSGVVVDAARPTTRKTRVIARAQHLLRFDDEVTEPLDSAVADQVVQEVARGLVDSDLLVLSDYAKVTLTDDVVRRCIESAHGVGVPIIVDPKRLDFELYRGASVLTPNADEAKRATRTDDASAAGEALRAAHPETRIVVTLGADGMLVFDGRSEPAHFAARAREVYDVTGAGDTVVAALAVALVRDPDIDAACRYASAAAAVAVGHLGAVGVTRAEVNAL